MPQEILLSVIFVLGTLLGAILYRLSALYRSRSLEKQLKDSQEQAKKKAQEIIEEAKTKALELKEKAQQEIDRLQQEIAQTQRFLREREQALGKKEEDLQKRREEIDALKQALEKQKQELKNKISEIQEKLESIAGITRQKAREEILRLAQLETQEEIKARLRKLEIEGEERFKERAREILATVIQRLATPQTHELSTTILHLPNEEIKGRIIGKDGRNIKMLEKLTGVEIIIDDTPETLIISGFNPVRRHIAKLALERLIKDGRIQPARIEEEVKKAEQEIEEQMVKMGEMALEETGVVGLDPRLVKLLGRLYFRTSYGQNVLLHSIEVSLIAGMLAAELGANVDVAKKAGLLHDIGKALDHEMEGSHVEIGIKVLEKFGVEQEVIVAMRSHHDDYPHETLEAVLVQTADKISGTRPGARKDTVENYIRRLDELEKMAKDEEGVERAFAIQGGRELRVFVQADRVSDTDAEILAKKIAKKIEKNLRYPGEIKVVVIREKRIVEVAR